MRKPKPPERVNHPKHYNAHPAGIECIDNLANKLLAHMMVAEICFFGDFEQNERGFYRPKYRKV